MGIGHRHHIAHQPTILRQRVGQCRLLLGAGNLESERIGANNGHELTIYLSSQTGKASALHRLDCRFIRRIESQNAAVFCSNFLRVWVSMIGARQTCRLPDDKDAPMRHAPHTLPTPQRPIVQAAVALGLILPLAGCAARYPLDIPEAQWEAMTPTEQRQAREQQAALDHARAEQRAAEARARE